jgi:hypothetical protein
LRDWVVVIGWYSSYHSKLFAVEQSTDSATGAKHETVFHQDTSMFLLLIMICRQFTKLIVSCCCFTAKQNVHRRLK